MKTQRSHEIPEVDSPLSWEESLTFLKFVIRFIMGSAVVYMAALMVLVPDQTWRVLVVAVMMLIAGSAWYLLSLGKARATVFTLAASIWIYCTIGAFFLGGLHSTTIVIYPIIILLLGWLAGARLAWTATALSIASTFVFALLDMRGHLPSPPVTPPLMRWAIQCGIFILTAGLIGHVTKSYRDRHDELRALSRDFARAQAVAHVGSWVYDIAGDRMQLSAETCRIFGVPEHTQSNHAVYVSRVHPDDRPAVEAAWSAALQGGPAFDNEHRILVGPSIRWVRQMAELELDGQGRAVRSVGTTQDITDRRNADDALRLARIGIETAGEPLFWITPDGRIVDANQAACRSLGYTREELLSLTVPDVDSEYNAQVWPDHFAELRRNGSLTFESTHRTKDGRLFPVEIVASHIRIGGEERNCAFIRDITERKRQAAEVLAARNQLAATLDAIPDLLFEMDLQGRYLACHAPRKDLLAAPVEDLLGRTVDEILPPAAAQTCLAALQEAWRTGASDGHQIELPVAGASLWFEFSVARKPVPPGEAPRFILLSRDITERRRTQARQAELESQLRESQKMEALGTLAGGIAHDFNNIVAAIIGNAELARQDVGDGHPALESLNEIRKASRRAKNLVRQILAFGRRQNLERKVISLAPVLQEAEQLLRATLPARVALDVRCDPATPAVFADASQIEQVILNLCTNAWQAVQDVQQDGRIRLQLQPQTRSGVVYAALCVRDNGAGMDAATSARIFEPFFTTKPPGQGTGLGLSVVHGILKEHEAEIEVHSEPGQGTEFVILFPAAPGERPGKPAAGTGSASAAARGKHVLYVDDEEAIVFLMQRLLERQGYRVSGFTSPVQALTAIQARPGDFDLAVTDYNMPEMSGLEVAQALKRIRPDLPVAMASGYITDELRQKAPGCGVDQLIYKPNTADDLCDAIGRLASAVIPNRK
jgi:PAS domain S-box-containing protein